MAEYSVYIPELQNILHVVGVWKDHQLRVRAYTMFSGGLGFNS